MIVLLIAGVAAVALLSYGGRKITVARARRLAAARLAAAAAAQAQARARAEEARRAWDGADDALTSVMPAIRLPWPTLLTTAAPPAGHADPGGGDARPDALPSFGAAPPESGGPPGPGHGRTAHGHRGAHAKHRA